MAASEILVIGNPKRKRRRGGPRRMSALQRKYFARRNPRRKSSRRRVRRNPAMALPGFSAPRRRSRSRRVAASARGRFRRRYSKSRGGMGFGGFIGQELIPAAIGAGGALALDFAWGSLPIPDILKTGTLAPVTRVAGAIGIGMLAGMIAGPRVGKAATAGALTVTAYDLIKGYVTTTAPAAAMNAYPMGAYPLGYVGPGAVSSYT